MKQIQQAFTQKNLTPPLSFGRRGSSPKAFTLVELIVVVTILAILATIGFVSYSGYLTGVRDTNRIASLTAISDGLELYRTKNDLPLPDNSVEVQVESEIIARQGYAGSNVLQTIEYSKAGKDPKDDQYYSYYLTDDKKHYQMMAFLEESDNLETRLNHSNQPHPQSLSLGREGSNPKVFFNYSPLMEGVGGVAFAATDYSNRHPKVYGKRLGILTDSDNTPIQEISTIKLVGNLNMTGGVMEEYAVHFSDGFVWEAKAKNLLALKDIGKTKGLQNSCTDIYVKNKSLKGGVKTFITFDDINNQIEEKECDMDNGTDKRYYRTFDGVNDYVGIPDITTTGDYIVEGSFIPNGILPNNQAILGDTSGFFIYIDTTGKIMIQYPISSGSSHNYNLSFIPGVVKFGMLNTFKLQREGDTVTFKVNDSIDTYTSANLDEIGISNIGRVGTNNYFSGKILDINFKSGWTYNGGVNPYYSLGDKYYAAKTKNNKKGPELITGTINTNNVVQDGNSFTFAQLSYGHFNVPVEANKQYLISGKMSGMTTNTRVGENDSSLYPRIADANGRFESVPPSDTSLAIYVTEYGNGNPPVVVEEISIREAPGYGRYYNFAISSVGENLQ